MAPLVRTGGSRHTGLAAPPHRNIQDDEAVVTMVDSNLQREQITASEKAYAYKMKYDAIKKKAGRKNRYVLYCAKRYVQI